MRNKFEKRIFQELKKAKVSVEYESERIQYLSTYIPDFVITNKSGKIIYIECKGYLRPEHKTKMNAVKRQHPDLDIRIVFHSIVGKRGKRDIKWANKHGLMYAMGSVPEEWLNE